MNPTRSNQAAVQVQVPEVRDARSFGGRVVIVDRRALVAQSIAFTLENAGVSCLVSTEPRQDAVERELAAYDPDVVLIDANDVDAAELVRAACGRNSQALVMSDGADRLRIAACIEAGASGAVSTLDGVEALLDAVQQVVSGRRLLAQSVVSEMLRELQHHRVDSERRLRPFATLSVRESFVLNAMMEGLSAAQIAEASYVSVATIRSQIKSILRKLRVNSQLAAVSLAYQAGWTMPQKTQSRSKSTLRSSHSS
ncbi:MAG: LuxR C-terminal-related transcriptional regulator [Acidimicrobiales bacterium]